MDGTILQGKECNLPPAEKHRHQRRSCPRKSIPGSTTPTTWHRRAPPPAGAERALSQGVVDTASEPDTAKLTAMAEEGAAGAAEAGEHARAYQNSQGGALSCLCLSHCSNATSHSCTIECTHCIKNERSLMMFV